MENEFGRKFIFPAPHVPSHDQVAVSFPTHAAFVGATISTRYEIAEVAYYTDTGKVRWASWSRVASVPTHPAKAQTADGGWWEFAGKLLAPWMLGAANDGTTDDSAIIGDTWDGCAALDIPLLLDGGAYGIGTEIVKLAGIHIIVEQATEWVQLGHNNILRVGDSTDNMTIGGHTLSANALTGAVSLTLTSGHIGNFAVGEDCLLISEALAVGNDHTARTAQPLRISKIATNTVHFPESPLWFDFLTADTAQLCNVDWIDGMRISGPGRLTVTGAAFAPASNATGTVATTASNTTVTGTGTAFLTQLTAGRQVRIVDTGEWLTIASITDNTHFVVLVAPTGSDASSAMEIYPYIQDYDMLTFNWCRDLRIEDGALALEGLNNVGINLDGCLRPHIHLDVKNGASAAFTTVAAGFPQTINGFSYGVAIGCATFGFDLVVNGDAVRHPVTTAQLDVAYGLPTGLWHDSVVRNGRGALIDDHPIGYQIVFENIDGIGGQYVGIQRRSYKSITRNVRIRNTIGAGLYLPTSAVDPEVDGFSCYRTNLGTDPLGNSISDWINEPAIRIDCENSNVRALTIEECGGPAYELVLNSSGKHVFTFDRIRHPCVRQTLGVKAAIRISVVESGDELIIQGKRIEGDGVNMVRGIQFNHPTITGEVSGLGPRNITGWTEFPWSFGGVLMPWRQPESTAKQSLAISGGVIDMANIVSRKVFLTGEATLNSVVAGPDGWEYTFWGSTGTPITITHGAANGFRNAGAASRVLDNAYKNITYIQEGSQMVEVSRADAV